MALPDGYLDALELLAVAFARYEADTGHVAVLVGGAATALQTAGAFMSGDFDVVAPNDGAFDRAMAAAGFLSEGGLGHGAGGWFHPSAPQYAVELVTPPLFDGRADPERLLRLTVRGASIVLPSIEDLIADRLAQHAVASGADLSRLEQARALLRMAKHVDRHYLERRIVEEGGNPALLDL